MLRVIHGGAHLGDPRGQLIRLSVCGARAVGRYYEEVKVTQEGGPVSCLNESESTPVPSTG
jgi:hypothetical protein